VDRKQEFFNLKLGGTQRKALDFKHQGLRENSREEDAPYVWVRRIPEMYN